MPETEDLYKVLQVHPTAETEVIQAAYRKLADRYHPDKNPSSDANARMTMINRAYETLSNPDERRAYDKSRAARTSSEGPSTGERRSRSRQAYGRQTGYARTGPGSGPTAAERSEEYLERGSEYFVQEKYQLALKFFNEAVRLDPSNADAFRARGVAYQRLGVEVMEDLNEISDLNSPTKRRRRVARIVVSILKNPAAVTGIGTVLLAVGLLATWSHSAVFITMMLGGAFGLGLAFDDLRKKKHNKNRMRPKHIAALIAVAGIFTATGLFNLLDSATLPTIVTLAGAVIMGIGLKQLLARRGRLGEKT